MLKLLLAVSTLLIASLQAASAAGFPPALRRAACTSITSIPYTIAAPGRYCLNADLVSNSHGIQIQASNVTLDCQSHAISRLEREAGWIGVGTTPRLRNVVIQNCEVKNFDSGMNLGFEGSNLQVLNNRIEDAISIGIQTMGNSNRIVGNHVIRTRQISPGQQSAGITVGPFGVGVASTSVVLINNVVAGTASDANPFGIMISGSTSPVLINNQVLDLRPTAAHFGLAIYLAQFQGIDTTDARLVNNVLMARVPNVLGISSVGGVTAICTGNVAIGLADPLFESSCQVNDNNSELP